MLSGMKPLPKALLIFLPIALAIGLYMKFAPEKKVEPVVVPVAVQVVPAGAAVVVAPTPAPATVVEPAPVADEAQNSGMKALMQKGKK
jgi:hypothetical protein